MSAIMITCPETGVEVPVGIDTDEASFQKIPTTVATTSALISKVGASMRLA